MKGVKVGPSAVVQKLLTVADSVAVAAPDCVGSVVMAWVGEMVEKLKLVSFFLPAALVVERTSHVLALVKIIYFQRDSEKL